LERGLLAGGVIFGIGAAIDGAIFIKWIGEHLGPLYEERPAIFATTLIVIGTQIIFGSFFLSFLQFKKSLSKPTLAPTEELAEPVFAQEAGRDGG
jgi:hypothetical protein